MSAPSSGCLQVVKVTFDSEQLPFGQLLDRFWDLHDPHSKDKQGNDRGTQYRAGGAGAAAAARARARAQGSGSRRCQPRVMAGRL
jgi:peptide methionine sulfoxide reductase MsrA